MDLNSNESIYTAVKEAHARISNHIRKTPLEYSVHLSKKTGCNVYLKLENEQITGSNKARGAFNKVLSLLEDPGHQGKSIKFFAVSSCGNHALAMMHALNQTGQIGEVYVPTFVKKNKLDDLEARGADVRIRGDDMDDTEIFARKEAETREGVFVSAYGDPEVLAGQGTVGLEIISELKHVDAIFVSVGGGGIIGGISSYVKHISPHTKVIGCSAEASNCMEQSIKHGKPINIVSKSTLADGLVGNIGLDSITFSVCQRNVDRWITVTEDEIYKAMFIMLNDHHKVAEGAAGVALASFLRVQEEYKGQNVVVLICGGYVYADDLAKVIDYCK
nr:L-threonine dehydratase catabolic TdcB-like isoform X2 [Styela clava]XP_039254522.1 L-threonine dehydratase catabolic TdcB-like isoform X2 [Styela clava]